MSKRHLVREEAAQASVDPGVTQIERLREAHGAYLKGLARKLCGRHYDPDDLLQDTYVRALASSIPEGANERAWLSRVMRNLFIDRVRQQTARRAQLERGLPSHVAEDGAWWQRLSEADVRAEVARLPPQQRATFELFTFAGESYDTIAEQLGISKNTVGTRVLRARHALRAMLTERYGS